MTNYKYINLPISYLESNNISKESFMQNSRESQDFLQNFFKKLPSFLELKNMFLVGTNFILALGTKKDILFDDDLQFKSFSEFIKQTNFIKYISINYEKKEISVSPDIPHIFYNLLYEFLV